MNDYKNIEKIKPEELLNLVREFLDRSIYFEYISGVQPFLMTFKKEKFYVYIKNISSAYFSDRDKTTRAQLPIKSEFKKIKESDIPFIFLGYDGVNDVFVCWNFHIAKERLNVGKSVSFYSRSFFQSEVKDGEFCRRQLKNGDLPVFFKRSYIVEFFKNIHSFFTANEDISILSNIKFLNNSLEDDFCDFMRNHKKLSEKLIANYSNALKDGISVGLKKYFLPKISTIFFIDDIRSLVYLKSKLFEIIEFGELNRIEKNMYSYAFDNYIDFLDVSIQSSISRNTLTVQEESSKYNNEGKLTEIVDVELLSTLEPYLSSNRILSAAQLVGDYYMDQFPKMQLKDWINLVKKIG
ncbi:hypothetical protein [Elizabethkingia anophelis]|uniref:hypothetical protein n=1 Tax=Elizabethkingia anophelis TaxID=1117645 RepID=UPI000994CFE7|nr:hypothetical protein [Elizabethkingia anophelis]AQW93068.1 hypothetical protein BBD30_02125 [Elizabethkingia anophelis]OPB61130.1 hypothetical protein BAS07_01560 [Elizabethkingia anophelis]